MCLYFVSRPKRLCTIFLWVPHITLQLDTIPYIASHRALYLTLPYMTWLQMAAVAAWQALPGF